jgi:hypothetical protein
MDRGAQTDEGHRNTILKWLCGPMELYALWDENYV